MRLNIPIRKKRDSNDDNLNDTYHIYNINKDNSNNMTVLRERNYIKRPFLLTIMVLKITYYDRIMIIVKYDLTMTKLYHSSSYN